MSTYFKVFVICNFSAIIIQLHGCIESVLINNGQRYYDCINCVQFFHFIFGVTLCSTPVASFPGSPRYGAGRAWERGQHSCALTFLLQQFLWEKVYHTIRSIATVAYGLVHTHHVLSYGLVHTHHVLSHCIPFQVLATFYHPLAEDTRRLWFSVWTYQ